MHTYDLKFDKCHPQESGLVHVTVCYSLEFPKVIITSLHQVRKQGGVF